MNIQIELLQERVRLLEQNLQVMQGLITHLEHKAELQKDERLALIGRVALLERAARSPNGTATQWVDRGVRNETQTVVGGPR